MSGVAGEDKIKNEYIRSSIGVASIVDEMRENRLKWLGRILRSEETVTVRLVKETYVEGRKDRKTEKEMVGCN